MDKIKVREKNGKLTLIWKWDWPVNEYSNWMTWLFVFVFTAVILFVTSIAVALLVHPVLGALMASMIIPVIYGALARFINSTWIEVDEKRLRLTHRPMPYVNNKLVLLADMNRHGLVINKRKLPPTRHYRQGVTTYTIAAKLRGGGTLELVKGLQNQTEARYIVGQVNAFLRADDVDDR